MLSTSETIKNKGGRPRVDAVPITVRLPPDLLMVIDAWIAARPDPKPSRPEVIREALIALDKRGGFSG